MLPIQRPSLPTDDRQRVLDATDIVRLIGEHVALKPKGREYVSLCPFHDDHTPSMFVVPSKQIYKCFSCGAGGNAIDFAVNYHKMSFREALEYLAERSGIQLTPRSLWRNRADQPSTSEDAPGIGRADLLAASSTAETFFRTILKHPEHGSLARQVIERRGISAETVEEFRLGAAPDKWDGLALTIGGKGLNPAPFLAAGLFKAREGSSGVYDAFRNRLIFPIHDQIGRVIAFGGRRLNDEEEPKYLNSAESAVFDKSTTLYALHQAAQAIRTMRRAIVTEGYMDAIACHQAGVKHVVATLGTALTPGNARILRRLADTIILLFDGDEAGQKAAERAVEIFFAEPVDVRIATLSSRTDAKDPDELLKREGGRAVLDEVLDAAIDPLELLFARVAGRLEGQGLSARGRAVQEFVARLVDLGLDRVDTVRFQLIVKRLAQITGVEWEAIASAIAERRSRRRPRETAAAAPAGNGLPDSLDAGEHLLACILNLPELAHSLQETDWELIEPEAYADPRMRTIARCVADLIVSEREPSLRSVLATLDDAEARRLATHVATLVGRVTEDDPSRIKAHWRSRLADAHRDRARIHTGVSADTPTDLVRGLQELRRARAGHRHDPRAVPRPSA